MSAPTFAVIRTGGKQYRVEAGDTVRVDSLDKKLGESFDLTDVLLVGGEKTSVGTPEVKNAKVTVTVVRHHKDKKIIVFKKKRRQGYRRTQGHRQAFTELFVSAITGPEGQSSKADRKAQVVDPAKKQARETARAEKLQAAGRTAVVAAKRKKAETKKKAAAKSVKKPAAKKPAKRKSAVRTTKKAAKKSK